MKKLNKFIHMTMAVVSLKILAGLVVVLDIKGEYGSMRKDNSTHSSVLTGLPEIG